MKTALSDFLNHSHVLQYLNEEISLASINKKTRHLNPGPLLSQLNASTVICFNSHLKANKYLSRSILIHKVRQFYAQAPVVFFMANIVCHLTRLSPLCLHHIITDKHKRTYPDLQARLQRSYLTCY